MGDRTMTGGRGDDDDGRATNDFREDCGGIGRDPDPGRAQTRDGLMTTLLSHPSSDNDCGGGALAAEGDCSTAMVIAGARARG